MGGEKLKWRQLAHHQLMSQQKRPSVKPKPMIKAQISGKLVTSGISDVAIASIHSEKTRLKKLIIIIMNLSQEKTVFGRRQKSISAMKLRLEK